MRNMDIESGSSGGVSNVHDNGTSIFSKTKHLKVMVVGDSMTHGTEGDHTWRYRIWEWMRDALPKTTIENVGPKVGTVPPAQAEPPKPPRLPEEPEEPERDVFTGGYAKDCSKDWKPNHFSQTGRAVWQAQHWIEETVKDYQPDLILLWLGFNDMAWGVTGPEDTYKNTLTFIANARKSKPDLHFVVGNCPQRPFMESYTDLFVNTEKFNSLLHWELPSLNTSKSRIAIAEIERTYGYVPDRGAGTYDTIHPNALGEYQIASSFSHTLHHSYGVGNRPLSIPKHVPPRPLPAPTNPQASGVPYGVAFTFDPVYGCVGYDIRQRHADSDDWEVSVSSVNRSDNSFTGAGTRWSFQARARYGDHEHGPWSPVVSAVAQRSTAPAPDNAKVYSLPTGFECTWDAVDDKWEVDRYAVLYKDKAGGYLCAKGVRGTRGVVDDLEDGHCFDVLLQSWNKDGPGMWKGVGSIRVGSGVFSRPLAER